VGAQLPVEAPGDPRALIEQIVDMVGVRISAQREAHHREGYELFTVDAVIATAHRHPERIIEPQMRQRCPLTRSSPGWARVVGLTWAFVMAY